MRGAFVFAAVIAVSVLAGCKAAPPTVKEYAYPDQGFAAAFQEAPKVTPGASFLVEDSVSGRHELVNVIDGSSSTKSESQALDDAPAALAQYTHATLGPVTYAATGKVVGREFTLQHEDKSAARARVFVFHKRLYQIIARTKAGPDDPEVMRFLNSFRLLDAPAA